MTDTAVVDYHGHQPPVYRLGCACGMTLETDNPIPATVAMFEAAHIGPGHKVTVEDDRVCAL